MYQLSSFSCAFMTPPKKTYHSRMCYSIDEDGWFVGQNTTSGGYGRFPSNFVEMLS